MCKFSRQFCVFLFLTASSCGQLAIAQQFNVPAQQVQTVPQPLPAPSLASPTSSNLEDAPKWILLRNMQVIRAKTCVTGERTALIMENGAELMVPTTGIQFQGENIDQIAKFRLAGIDPNSIQSQVEFVEWAIRYDMNGLAKLQLNELIIKYPQSQKLQLLTRRIESNELMKQQQTIAATMPAPEVAKAAFVAPIPKSEAKTDTSKKQLSGKNMGRANLPSKNGVLAKKSIDSATPLKTFPSIAIPSPIVSPKVANSSISALDPTLPQRKPRESTNLAPENSADPFDPDVFNRMHAKSEKSDESQESVPQMEMGKIIRR